MSRGEVYRRVRLVGEQGDVDLPFLELGEELWDPEGRRLTLLFDPGRIKRGLKPREDAGQILQPGKRYALPNSRILIHQPMGGFQGQASDIDIHAQEILRMRNDLNRILAAHTGQNIRKIKKDTERDYFMNAEEAKKYGIIDKVLEKRTNPDEETES